jgi:hypothetical protein
MTDVKSVRKVSRKNPKGNGEEKEFLSLLGPSSFAGSSGRFHASRYFMGVQFGWHGNESAF